MSLVIVLVLLVVGALLVVALANAASNDLSNTGSFSKARSLSYDATSAIDAAIQSMRYVPQLKPTETLNASPPGACWPTKAQGGTWPAGEPLTALPHTSGPKTSGQMFRVWCSTRWIPSSARTRTVTFDACRIAVATIKTTVTKAEAQSTAESAACAPHPFVQEVVIFDDYPGGKATPTQAPCHTYCGSYMTVESWVEHPKMPTVTLLSCAPGQSTCTPSPIGAPSSGGVKINVIGTGFVTGSTVQFVEEKARTPVVDNMVATATSVSFNSSTSLTVVVPPVTEGSTYYVTVTTPVGTSAYSTADVFNYRAKLPTVTSVCTGVAGTTPTKHPTTCSTSTSTKASGPMSGGGEVTIWGSSFLCTTSCSSGVGLTVDFGLVKAQYVTVVSPTEITVTAPAQYATPPESVAVKVTTPGGTNSSVHYEYVAVIPTVESASLITSTTKVLIKGTGFYDSAGDVVEFTPAKSTGAPTTTPSKVKSISSITIVTATTIKSSLPTLTTGEKYFVTVTAPVGMSSYYPTITYK